MSLQFWSLNLVHRYIHVKQLRVKQTLYYWLCSWSRSMLHCLCNGTVSVGLSVCLSHLPPAAQCAVGLLLRARRAGNIDRLPHDRLSRLLDQRSLRLAATASSVTLSADVRSWTQTVRKGGSPSLENCIFFVQIIETTRYDKLNSVSSCRVIFV